MSNYWYFVREQGPEGRIVEFDIDGNEEPSNIALRRLITSAHEAIAAWREPSQKEKVENSSLAAEPLN